MFNRRKEATRFNMKTIWEILVTKIEMGKEVKRKDAQVLYFSSH